MRSRRATAALIVTVLLGLGQPLARAEDAPRVVALRCGRLLDGRHPAPVEDVTLLVEGDRIRQVGRGLAVPAGADLMTSGAHLPPG